MDDGATETYGYSIVASEALDMVFTGGGEAQAWIMGTDLLTGRVKWRRFYKASGTEMNTVTAMSIRSDGSSMAVVASHHSSHNVQWFFTIRPIDGGHQTDVVKYTIGDSGIAEHKVKDSGLFYADNGIVYVAMRQVSATMRNSIDGTITNYGGRMLVGAYEPSSDSILWMNEQKNFFGFSGAILHKDYGAGQPNIFVGGSIDQSYTTSTSTTKSWSIAIMRLKEDGQASATEDSMFYITQDYMLTIDDSPQYAPIVDHMYLDDTSTPGEEWLFGSSIAWTEGRDDLTNDGGRVFIWKVKLDANHNPDPSFLSCVKYGHFQR